MTVLLKESTKIARRTHGKLDVIAVVVIKILGSKINNFAVVDELV